MVKKKLNTESVQSELQGSSFFHALVPSVSEPVRPAPKSKKSVKARPAKPRKKIVKESMEDVRVSRSHDVVTSVKGDINMKLWREIIEETETHNSSLRLSAKERDRIEDVVRDLKRKYKVKTSMNEISRLGLLLLIYDFQHQGEQSIIVEVKKS